MADQVLFGGFRRLGNFALDPTSVVDTLAQLQFYLEHDPTAHDGQQIVVTKDPNPENNGIHAIIIEKKEINGVVVEKKAIQKTASMEQLKEAIKIEGQRIETELIMPIKQFLGMSDSEGTENENNILSRIQKIESLLSLDDEDDENDKIEDLTNEITNLINDLSNLKEQVGSDKLAEIFATKAEMEAADNSLDSKISNFKIAIDTKIEQIENLLDLLDDNKDNNSVILELSQLNKSFDIINSQISDIKEKDLVSLQNQIDELSETVLKDFNIDEYLKNSTKFKELENKIIDPEIGLENRISSVSKILQDNYYTKGETEKVIKSITSNFVTSEQVKNDINSILDGKDYATTATVSSKIEEALENIESKISYTGVKRIHNFIIEGAGRETNIWCTGDQDSLHHVGDILEKITVKILEVPATLREETCFFSCKMGSDVLFDENDIIFSAIGDNFEFIINREITSEINNFGFSHNLQTELKLEIFVEYTTVRNDI